MDERKDKPKKPDQPSSEQPDVGKRAKDLLRKLNPSSKRKDKKLSKRAEKQQAKGAAATSVKESAAQPAQPPVQRSSASPVVSVELKTQSPSQMQPVVPPVVAAVPAAVKAAPVIEATVAENAEESPALLALKQKAAGIMGSENPVLEKLRALYALQLENTFTVELSNARTDAGQKMSYVGNQITKLEEELSIDDVRRKKIPELQAEKLELANVFAKKVAQEKTMKANFAALNDLMKGYEPTINIDSSRPLSDIFFELIELKDLCSKLNLESAKKQVNGLMRTQVENRSSAEILVFMKALKEGSQPLYLKLDILNSLYGAIPAEKRTPAMDAAYEENMKAVMTEFKSACVNYSRSLCQMLTQIHPVSLTDEQNQILGDSAASEEQKIEVQAKFVVDFVKQNNVTKVSAADIAILEGSDLEKKKEVFAGLPKFIPENETYQQFSNKATSYFNDLKNFVTAAILAGDQEGARYAIRQWISVVSECMAQKDYATAYFVYTAFGQAALGRIVKQLPTSVERDQIEAFGELFSPMGNFKNIRPRILADAQTGPTTPIFFLVIKDITAIYDANDKLTANILANGEMLKYTEMAKKHAENNAATLELPHDERHEDTINKGLYAESERIYTRGAVIPLSIKFDDKSAVLAEIKELVPGNRGKTGPTSSRAINAKIALIKPMLEKAVPGEARPELLNGLVELIHNIELKLDGRRHEQTTADAEGRNLSEQYVEDMVKMEKNINTLKDFAKFHGVEIVSLQGVLGNSPEIRTINGLILDIKKAVAGYLVAKPDEQDVFKISFESKIPELLELLNDEKGQAIDEESYARYTKALMQISNMLGIDLSQAQPSLQAESKKGPLSKLRSTIQDRVAGILKKEDKVAQVVQGAEGPLYLLKGGEKVAEINALIAEINKLHAEYTVTVDPDQKALLREQLDNRMRDQNKLHILFRLLDQPSKENSTRANKSITDENKNILVRLERQLLNEMLSERKLNDPEWVTRIYLKSAGLNMLDDSAPDKEIANRLFSPAMNLTTGELVALTKQFILLEAKFNEGNQFLRGNSIAKECLRKLVNDVSPGLAKGFVDRFLEQEKNFSNEGQFRAFLDGVFEDLIPLELKSVFKALFSQSGTPQSQANRLMFFVISILDPALAEKYGNDLLASGNTLGRIKNRMDIGNETYKAFLADMVYENIVNLVEPVVEPVKVAPAESADAAAAAEYVASAAKFTAAIPSVVSIVRKTAVEELTHVNETYLEGFASVQTRSAIETFAQQFPQDKEVQDFSKKYVALVELFNKIKALDIPDPVQKAASVAQMLRNDGTWEKIAEYSEVYFKIRSNAAKGKALDGTVSDSMKLQNDLGQIDRWMSAYAMPLERLTTEAAKAAYGSFKTLGGLLNEYGRRPEKFEQLTSINSKTPESKKINAALAGVFEKLDSFVNGQFEGNKQGLIDEITDLIVLNAKRITEKARREKFEPSDLPKMEIMLRNISALLYFIKQINPNYNSASLNLQIFNLINQVEPGNNEKFHSFDAVRAEIRKELGLDKPVEEVKVPVVSVEAPVLSEVSVAAAVIKAEPEKILAKRGYGPTWDSYWEEFTKREQVFEKREADEPGDPFANKLDVHRKLMAENGDYGYLQFDSADVLESIHRVAAAAGENYQSAFQEAFKHAENGAHVFLRTTIETKLREAEEAKAQQKQDFVAPKPVSALAPQSSFVVERTSPPASRELPPGDVELRDLSEPATPSALEPVAPPSLPEEPQIPDTSPLLRARKVDGLLEKGRKEDAAEAQSVVPQEVAQPSKPASSPGFLARVGATLGNIGNLFKSKSVPPLTGEISSTMQVHEDAGTGQSKTTERTITQVLGSPKKEDKKEAKQEFTFAEEEARAPNETIEQIRARAMAKEAREKTAEYRGGMEEVKSDAGVKAKPLKGEKVEQLKEVDSLFGDVTEHVEDVGGAQPQQVAPPSLVTPPKATEAVLPQREAQESEVKEIPMHFEEYISDEQQIQAYQVAAASMRDIPNAAWKEGPNEKIQQIKIYLNSGEVSEKGLREHVEALEGMLIALRNQNPPPQAPAKTERRTFRGAFARKEPAAPAGKTAAEISEQIGAAKYNLKLTDVLLGKIKPAPAATTTAFETVSLVTGEAALSPQPLVPPPSLVTPVVQPQVPQEVLPPKDKGEASDAAVVGRSGEMEAVVPRRRAEEELTERQSLAVKINKKPTSAENAKDPQVEPDTKLTDWINGYADVLEAVPADKNMQRVYRSAKPYTPLQKSNGRVDSLHFKLADGVVYKIESNRKQHYKESVEYYDNKHEDSEINYFTHLLTSLNTIESAQKFDLIKILIQGHTEHTFTGISTAIENLQGRLVEKGYKSLAEGFEKVKQEFATIEKMVEAGRPLSEIDKAIQKIDLGPVQKVRAFISNSLGQQTYRDLVNKPVMLALRAFNAWKTLGELVDHQGIPHTTQFVVDQYNSLMSSLDQLGKLPIELKEKLIQERNEFVGDNEAFLKFESRDNIRGIVERIFRDNNYTAGDLLTESNVNMDESGKIIIAEEQPLFEFLMENDSDKRRNNQTPQVKEIRNFEARHNSAIREAVPAVVEQDTLARNLTDMLDLAGHKTNTLLYAELNAGGIPESLYGTAQGGGRVEIRYFKEGESNQISSAELQKRVNFLADVAKEFFPEDAIKNEKIEYIRRQYLDRAAGEFISLHTSSEKTFERLAKQAQLIFLNMEKELVKIAVPEETKLKAAMKKFKEKTNKVIIKRGRPTVIHVVRGKDGVDRVNVSIPKFNSGEEPKSYPGSYRNGEAGQSPNSTLELSGKVVDGKVVIQSALSRASSFSLLGLKRKGEKAQRVYKGYKNTEADLDNVLRLMDFKDGATVYIQSTSLLTTHRAERRKGGLSAFFGWASESRQAKEHHRNLEMYSGQPRIINGKTVTPIVTHVNVSVKDPKSLKGRVDNELQDLINNRGFMRYMQNQVRALKAAYPGNQTLQDWLDKNCDPMRAIEIRLEQAVLTKGENSKEANALRKEYKEKVYDTRNKETQLQEAYGELREMVELGRGGKINAKAASAKRAEILKLEKDLSKRYGVLHAELRQIWQAVPPPAIPFQDTQLAYFADSLRMFYTGQYREKGYSMLFAAEMGRANSLAGEFGARNCKTTNDRTDWEVGHEKLLAEYEDKHNGKPLLSTSTDLKEQVGEPLQEIHRKGVGKAGLDYNRPGASGNKWDNPWGGYAGEDKLVSRLADSSPTYAERRKYFWEARKAQRELKKAQNAAAPAPVIIDEVKYIPLPSVHEAQLMADAARGVFETAEEIAGDGRLENLRRASGIENDVVVDALAESADARSVLLPDLSAQAPKINQLVSQEDTMPEEFLRKYAEFLRIVKDLPIVNGIRPQFIIALVTENKKLEVRPFNITPESIATNDNYESLTQMAEAINKEIVRIDRYVAHLLSAREHLFDAHLPHQGEEMISLSAEAGRLTGLRDQYSSYVQMITDKQAEMKRAVSMEAVTETVERVVTSMTVETVEFTVTRSGTSAKALKAEPAQRVFVYHPDKKGDEKFEKVNSKVEIQSLLEENDQHIIQEKSDGYSYTAPGVGKQLDPTQQKELVERMVEEAFKKFEAEGKPITKATDLAFEGSDNLKALAQKFVEARLNKPAALVEEPAAPTTPKASGGHTPVGGGHIPH